MKKIMILGANTLQIPLIQTAKKEGHQVIVVAPNKEEPGFSYADIPLYIDLKNQDEILEAAKSLKIDGIITDQTDIPVRTVAYVAENLNLPGIGYDTACLFTNKYKMRLRCEELGIPTLQYRLVRTAEEALRFWRLLDKPVIVKPVDNQGSKGVLKANSETELREKFASAFAYSRCGEVLIEECVEGVEFFAEGIAFNYEFKNLCCGDTHYFKIPDVFSATTRIVPSERNADLVDRVKEINEKIVRGFGLKQGLSHSEYIVSDGVIYLLETAARGGGVFISSDLIPLSTGLNTEKFLLDVALGIQSNMPVLYETETACGYMSFFLPVGRIVHIEGLEEAENLSFTQRNNFSTIYVGKETKPYIDKTARYFIIVKANNLADLRDHMSYIRSIINIQVQTESGLKGPIWE